MSYEAKDNDGMSGYCMFTFTVTGKFKLNTVHTFEPPRGKTNNVVSEQVRHKPACISAEKS